MRVLKEYKNHHYWGEFEKTHMHCPNCGASEVFVEQGEGDYYQGPNHVCTACSFWFTMPSGRLSDEASQRKIVEQLRSGKAHGPTTPHGGGYSSKEAAGLLEGLTRAAFQKKLGDG